MSNEVPDTSSDRDADAMAGSGAGDAAHTAKIPRISSDDAAGTDRETDKGRPRAAGSSKSAPSTSAPSKSGPSKSGPAKTAKSGPTKSAAAASPKKAPAADAPSTDKPLTASDYARTTDQSPSSTAVIPAVKAERQASSMPQTVAPHDSRQQDTSRPSMTMTESSSSGGDARGGRAATLRLSYVEPWSVTRMAFAISVAMMIVGVVGTAIFWVVLDVTGVWGQIDGSVSSVLSDNSSSFRITDYLGFTRLVGLSLVISALNVVIMTILATIAAHLYNLAAQLLGGFEVTYTSKD